jgi:predicted transcriptional regulator
MIKVDILLGILSIRELTLIEVAEMLETEEELALKVMSFLSDYGFIESYGNFFRITAHGKKFLSI